MLNQEVKVKPGDIENMGPMRRETGKSVGFRGVPTSVRRRSLQFMSRQYTFSARICLRLVSQCSHRRSRVRTNIRTHTNWQPVVELMIDLSTCNNIAESIAFCSFKLDP